MPTQARKVANKSGTSKRTKQNASVNRPRSGILESIHETVSGMYKAGVVDKTTMRSFDALCSPPVPSYTPRQIRQLRTRCNASQAAFAACLNVTVSALQKWEIGAKKPNGVARKLLYLVDTKGLEILLI